MADAWQAQMGELTKPGKVGGGGSVCVTWLKLLLIAEFGDNI